MYIYIYIYVSPFGDLVSPRASAPRCAQSAKEKAGTLGVQSKYVCFRRECSPNMVPKVTDLALLDCVYYYHMNWPLQLKTIKLWMRVAQRIQKFAMGSRGGPPAYLLY